MENRVIGPAFWPLVTISFLLAVGLRLFVITEPLWLDELHTAWVIDGPLEQVFPRAAAGNQAPLYFWLSWLISQVFGLSAVSMRLLSLASSVLLIAASARFVFKWTGSPTACVSVLVLLALDPLMIFYATEARPYALLQLGGFIQIAAVWELWRTQSQIDTTRREWVPIVLVSVCSAILFYVHFTSVLLFAAEAAFVFVSLCSQWRRLRNVVAMISKILLALGLTVLMCLPMIGQLSVVLDRKGQWASVSSVESLLNELLMPLIFSVGLPIATVGLLWISGQRLGYEKSKQLQLLGLFAFCALVPIGMACVTDQLFPLAHPRYVVISSVAMFVFAALVIGSIKSQTGQFFLAAIVLISNSLFNPLAQTLVSTGELIPFRRENWESPIEQINGVEQEADKPVFLIANVLEDSDAATNHHAEFQDYLRFPVNGIYKIKNAKRVIPLASATERPFADSHIDLIKGQGRAWILFRATRQHVNQVLSALQNEFPEGLDLEYFASPDSDVILVRLYTKRDQ